MKVCCNCKHNIRTGEAPDIECHCELDGSFIGYVQCMDYRCEHWEGEEIMSNFEIHFVNGAILKVDSTCDVGFHEITGQYVSFDNLFINIGNVLYIKKEEAEK